MDDRTLSALMAKAARKATEVCLARGLGRADSVTIRSARTAAEDVYRQHRAPDPAPAVVLPTVAPSDPVKARIDREEQE